MDHSTPQPLTVEDLPSWMRPRAERFDYPFVLMVVVCVVIALPWLTRAGIPPTLETHAQIARLNVVAESFQQGVIYPRWASHFHYGYGSPLLNYLAPTPHYLGGIHLLLAQSSPHISFKFVMTLGIFSAGLGMFSFVRGRWGDMAGLIASLIYLLSPVTLYRVAYLEGDLGLMLALGLFPCTLWAVDRVIRTRERRDILWLSLSVALLLASSNWLGMLLLAVVILWAAWWLWLTLPHDHWQFVSIGIILGVGLVALYWLPALAEWEAIRWHPLEQTLRPLSLAEVFSQPAPSDLRVLNQPITGSVGLATSGLFGLGSFIVILEARQRDKLALALLPFIGLAVLSVMLTTQLRADWLDNLSQFPRFSRLDGLIPAVAAAAIVSGQCALGIQHYIPNRLLQTLSFGLVVVMPVVAAFPILEPPLFVPYRSSDPLNDYLQLELRGTLQGSLQQGLLLPKDVPTMPLPSFALVDSYLADEVVKVERASRLPQANLGIISHGPTHDRLRVNQIQPNDLEILTFNFLGWQATFLDDPVDIHSAANTGFISVAMPVGRGVLFIWLGNTRARLLGMFISLVSLVLLGGVVSWQRKTTAPPLNLVPQVASRGTVLSLGILAMLLILVGRTNTTHPSLLRGMTTYPHVFEGGVDLLGYEVETKVYRPQDSFSFRLYWEAVRPNLPDYRMEVSLINAQTQARVTSVTHRIVGGWQTSYWQQGQYVADTYYFRLPAQLPAGIYQLEVRVLRCGPSQLPYECSSPTPLRIFDPRGNLLGETLILPPQLTVD